MVDDLKEPLRVLSGRLDVMPDGGLHISYWHIEGRQISADEPPVTQILGIIIEYLQQKREESLLNAKPVITVELEQPELARLTKD